MEKISALIDKLQALKNNGASLNDLAYYTQLLYAELMCAKKAPDNAQPSTRKKVAVIMPGQTSQAMVTSERATMPVEEYAYAEEHELVTEQQEADREQSASLFSGNQEYRSREASHAQAVFETPPVPRQAVVAHPAEHPGRELNEMMAEQVPSLNDRLKRQEVELATKLTDSQAVADLSKAIGVNDKFLFINELFRGDRNMFDRSVKTINGCGGLAEAEYWIGRELKIKLGWQDTNQTVQQFYHLVKKRFSSM
jgi:hypothetical protein